MSIAVMVPLEEAEAIDLVATIDYTLNEDGRNSLDFRQSLLNSRASIIAALGPERTKYIPQAPL